MKLRWLILFFLLGAVGVILLQLTACSPSSQTASAPSFEKAEPSVYASSSASPAASTSAPGKAIDNAIVKLPQGEAYQNVPEKMQVGVAETIEAGIIPQVTEKIKKELQGKIKKELQGNGTINIQPGVHYDPAGVEMKLFVDKDEFKKSDVKVGKQFVAENAPGKWLWQVMPLKEGNHLIRVTAVIDLNVPALKTTRPVEIEVFSTTRKVQVNWGYSISQFVSTNWKEVLGLVIGSGSLASLTTWLIGRKDKKAEAG